MAFGTYNSYMPNNQFLSQPMQPQYNMGGAGYQNYQPQQNIARQPQQNIQQETSPFSQIIYATMDEAKNYIVYPSQTILFIHRDKSAFSIKSTDLAGNTTFESFQYSKINDTNTEVSQDKIDTSIFLKKEDISGLPTKDDLKNFMTKEDSKVFLTKDDLKSFEAKLDQIQRQIKINQILNEDKPTTNG